MWTWVLSRFSQVHRNVQKFKFCETKCGTFQTCQVGPKKLKKTFGESLEPKKKIVFWRPKWGFSTSALGGHLWIWGLGRFSQVHRNVQKFKFCETKCGTFQTCQVGQKKIKKTFGESLEQKKKIKFWRPNGLTEPFQHWKKPVVGKKKWKFLLYWEKISPILYLGGVYSSRKKNFFLIFFFEVYFVRPCG